MTIDQKTRQTPYCDSVANFLNIGAKNRTELITVDPYIAKLKGPWEYDFKYQYENYDSEMFWNLDDDEDTAIERLLKYKIEYKVKEKIGKKVEEKINNKIKNAFDCDGCGAGVEMFVCWLTRQIYRTLWDWKDVKAESERTVKHYGPLGTNVWQLNFGPDTMNSFIKLFNHTLENTAGEKNILCEHKEFINNNYYGGKDKQQHVSQLFLYRLLVEHKYDKGIDLGCYLPDDSLKSWGTYAEVYHTIGNFVLVPEGFNTYRCDEFNDFWDRSLQYLKRQMNENAWLRASHVFERYINYFFLWDYVFYRDKSGYYVKSLLSNEFPKNDGYSGGEPISGKSMPTKEETAIFLKNVPDAIRRRGIFMTAMLQLQASRPELYKKLKKEVFATANCYCGYADVLSAMMGKSTLPDTVVNILMEEAEFKEAIQNYKRNQ